MKVPYTFKLDPVLLLSLREQAEFINRAFNNHVETILLTHIQNTQKKKKR